DCEGVLITADPFFYTYDTEPPQILRIASLSPQEIKIYFNESVKKSTVETVGNYTINNEEGVQAAKMADSSTVSLVLSYPLEINAYHSLTVLQLTDESNNLSERLTEEFFLDDQLDTAIIAGPSLLNLYFHTAVDSLSASTGMNYFLDRNIGHPKSAFRDAENHKRVNLVFDRDLPQNNQGTVTVENIKDSSGTYINTHRKTFFHDTRSISVNRVEWLNDS